MTNTYLTIMSYPIFLFLLVILSHSIYPSYTHTHHTHSLLPIAFIPAEAAPGPPGKDEKSGGSGCGNEAVEVMSWATRDCVSQPSPALADSAGQQEMLDPVPAVTWEPDNNMTAVAESAEAPTATGRYEKSVGHEDSEAGGGGCAPLAATASNHCSIDPYNHLPPIVASDVGGWSVGPYIPLPPAPPFWDRLEFKNYLLRLFRPPMDISALRPSSIGAGPLSWTKLPGTTSDLQPDTSNQWPRGSRMAQTTTARQHIFGVAERTEAILRSEQYLRSYSSEQILPTDVVKQLLPLYRSLYDDLKRRCCARLKDNPSSAVTRVLVAVLPPADEAESLDEGFHSASFIGVEFNESTATLPHITVDVVLKLTAVLAAERCSGDALAAAELIAYASNGGAENNWVEGKLSWVLQVSTFQQDRHFAFPRIDLKGMDGETRTVFRFSTMLSQQMQDVPSVSLTKRLELTYKELASAPVGKDDPPSGVTSMIASVILSADEAQEFEADGIERGFIGVNEGVDGLTMLPCIDRDVVLRLAAVLMDRLGLNKQTMANCDSYMKLRDWVGGELYWEPESFASKKDGTCAYPRIVLKGQQGKTLTAFQFAACGDQQIQLNDACAFQVMRGVAESAEASGGARVHSISQDLNIANKGNNERQNKGKSEGNNQLQLTAAVDESPYKGMSLISHNKKIPEKNSEKGFQQLMAEMAYAKREKARESEPEKRSESKRARETQLPNQEPRSEFQLTQDLQVGLLLSYIYLLLPLRVWMYLERGLPSSE
eukprot:GHVQ01030133.1.p1 GENE.GHVQ01030133.1~~GHVQ01030133.1.p1  ORF type:complete len:770 (-),score=85.69 GHVQ01030133.1:596-2905(-)